MPTADRILQLLLNDVLRSIHTSLGVSLIVAFCSIYFYLFAFKTGAMHGTQRGGRAALRIGIKALTHDKDVRHFFWLILYTTMVLCRTLLIRHIWPHPLSKVFGGWWIWTTGIYGQRKLSADCIGNLIMLMPMVGLSIWTFPDWFRRKGFIKGSFLLAGGTSLLIETLQLVFRLGTFQFSDLVYNTAGGVAAGMIAKEIYKKASNSMEKM